MTQSQASKIFSIPRQTLQYRIYKHKKKDEVESKPSMANNVTKDAARACIQQTDPHIRAVLDNLYNKTNQDVSEGAEVADSPTREPYTLSVVDDIVNQMFESEVLWILCGI